MMFSGDVPFARTSTKHIIDDTCFPPRRKGNIFHILKELRSLTVLVTYEFGAMYSPSLLSLCYTRGLMPPEDTSASINKR